jgi:hypothetical protein
MLPAAWKNTDEAFSGVACTRLAAVVRICVLRIYNLCSARKISKTSAPRLDTTEALHPPCQQLLESLWVYVLEVLGANVMAGYMVVPTAKW